MPDHGASWLVVAAAFLPRVAARLFLFRAAGAGGRRSPVIPVAAELAGYALAIALSDIVLLPLVAAWPPAALLVKLAIIAYLVVAAVRLWRTPLTLDARGRTIAVLAGVAFAISSYMALYQWRLIDSVWDPVFRDQTTQVLDSDVSEQMRRWFRIPDAALGALAYLGDVIFGLAGSTRRWQYRPWMVVLFGLDVIPLGVVSAVLVVLQGTMVGAWCFLCLITAAISLILVFLAYDEVWSSLAYLWRVWRRTRNARLVWDSFWGRPSQAADEAALAVG